MECSLGVGKVLNGDKLMEGFTARCIRKLRRLLFKFIVYKTIGSVLTTVKEEFGLPLTLSLHEGYLE